MDQTKIIEIELILHLYVISLVNKMNLNYSFTDIF